MDKEIQAKLDELGKAFEAFKTANDQRLVEIQAKGSASADVVATVEKANAAITELRGQLEALQTSARANENLIARIEALGRRGSDEAEQQVRGHVRSFLALRGVRREPTAEDVTHYQAYRTAFGAYLRAPSERGGISLVPEIRAAMTSGTDPEGGYFLPSDLSGRLVQMIYETSPIRQFANVETTSRREVTGRNDLGEAGGGWSGEQTAPSESAAPGIGEWKIPIVELYAEPKATQDELDDTEFDVEGWLLKKIANKLSRLENTAAVSGNGVSKWRGFLTYAAGTPAAALWNVIQQTNTGAAADFAAAPAGGDVFLTTIGKMKVDYRQNARWAMNRTTEAEVRKLKDSNGNYVWQTATTWPGLAAGAPAVLAGYPVALFEDMPAIAANALAIAYADFKQAYEIRDRRGVSVLRDPFTGKPFVKFYSTKRSGGDVVNFEAIKIIKIAA